MDNIKQVVKDIRFLIATNCCDETIQTRIENFINERDQALRIHDVSGSVCDNCGEGKPFICAKCYEIESNFRESY